MQGNAGATEIWDGVFIFNKSAKRVVKHYTDQHKMYVNGKFMNVYTMNSRKNRLMRAGKLKEYST